MLPLRHIFKSMKNLVSFLVFAISLAACTPKSNPAAEQQLLQMLEKKDLFRLEAQLEGKKSELSKGIVLYLEAFLQNAFDQTELSLQTINAIIPKHVKSLNDTLMCDIYGLKYDNLHKQYRYREAAEALKHAMEKYGHTADSVDFAGMQGAYSIVESLKNFPLQKMHNTTDVTIPIWRNPFDHVMLTVTSGGQSEDFVFDTGAMLSVVSESCAQKMSIRGFEASLGVGNSVGSEAQSKVGVADNLQVGGLLLENN